MPPVNKPIYRITERFVLVNKKILISLLVSFMNHTSNCAQSTHRFLSLSLKNLRFPLRTTYRALTIYHISAARRNLAWVKIILRKIPHFHYFRIILTRSRFLYHGCLIFFCPSFRRTLLTIESMITIYINYRMARHLTTICTSYINFHFICLV